MNINRRSFLRMAAAGAMLGATRFLPTPEPIEVAKVNPYVGEIVDDATSEWTITMGRGCYIDMNGRLVDFATDNEVVYLPLQDVSMAVTGL